MKQYSKIFCLSSSLLVLVAWIALNLSCTSTLAADKGVKSHVLLLEYQDFGPQVIAHELIGMQSYQWNAVGDENVRDHIVIAVFSGQSEADVRKQFPVDRATKHDYRYISQKAAIDFLVKEIADLKNDQDLDASVRENLLRLFNTTAKKIQDI